MWAEVSPNALSGQLHKPGLGAFQAEERVPLQEVGPMYSSLSSNYTHLAILSPYPSQNGGILKDNITNSMEQRPSWEANRSSASQEIPRIVRNSKVYYRIHKSSPVRFRGFCEWFFTWLYF